MFGTQVFQVSETIWCVRSPSYFTCSYIVNTPNGVVSIDAGMNSEGHDMEFGLAKLGKAPADVKAILLTHWHNDHAAGGQAIQRMSNAPVFYHANEAPFLTRESAAHGLRGRLSDLMPEWGPFVLFKGLLGEATPNAVEANTLVLAGQVIMDSFEVVESPGHTPGHLCFYYPKERALFAGDALAVVGDRVHFMARPVTPDLEQARASMIRCLSLDIELLCPGHRWPLTKDTQKRCQEMAEYLREGGKWPLLG